MFSGVARVIRAFAFVSLVLPSLTIATEDVLYTRRLLRRQDVANRFNISFYHINDVHAHLDEFSSSGTDCTTPARGCYGGYSRVQTVVNQTRPTHPNSLFLNAGDEFQGTLFYSFYGGEKIAQTLNQLGFDGMTLGNHEFDGGDDKLGAFLDNLTFPIISANIKSTHPILNRTIKPYYIYEDYQLAVIGVTTETTPGLSSPGEGTTFSNSIQAVQDTVDLIRSTTNITRIVALTHIGYDEDQRLAEQTTGLHLIMGGHSHTPLGNFTGATGPYPTIVENRDGEEVFVVTAYRWGEYLGYIDVVFDPSGRIVSYRGAPIHLTNTTTQDPDLQAQIEEWRRPFEAFAAEEIGTSNVVLDQSACRTQECVLGNFMADAMLEYRLNATSSSNAARPDFALINAGGIRATIDAGPVTRGEVLTAFPFGNAIAQIPFSGSDLWTVLEGIVTRVNQKNQKPVTSFLQVSRGINITYNALAANGSKLTSVNINGASLERSSSRTYQVVTLDFLARGGDNFWDPVEEFAALDLQDEVLTRYVQSQSPINAAIEGRIRTVNGTSTTGGNTTPTGTGSGSSTSTNAAASITQTGTVTGNFALVMLTYMLTFTLGFAL